MNEKEKIKLLVSSYEKEIDFCKRLLEDIEDDEKSRIIYETMLREKTMFIQVLKNI
jgi:hypothetical protein